MEKMIAFCGLDCGNCAAYIASKTGDNELRKKTAEEWTKLFNFNFTPEMINCHGCHATDGVQVGYCSMCEIRKCALGKSVQTCGKCTDYPCTMIAEFHKTAPGTEENLRNR